MGRSDDQLRLFAEVSFLKKRVCERSEKTVLMTKARFILSFIPNSPKLVNYKDIRHKEMKQWAELYRLAYILSLWSFGSALSGRVFFHMPTEGPKPQLVLISGCTGTGKSTFGMSVALNQGVLRCISTDSVRQVMRAYRNDPALHRSSYSGSGDPIVQWRECCDVLNESMESVVQDAINRGISLVMEGVHIVPSSHYLDMWRKAGGVALGCVLVIKDENAHRNLIGKRGEITHKGAEGQMKAFSRIRVIQEEMIRLAKENNWLLIEQKLEPDPIDQVTDILNGSH